MAALGDSPTRNLSGGQKQRVAIASALVDEPRVSGKPPRPADAAPAVSHSSVSLGLDIDPFNWHGAEASPSSVRRPPLFSSIFHFLLVVSLPALAYRPSLPCCPPSSLLLFLTVVLLRLSFPLDVPTLQPRSLAVAARQDATSHSPNLNSPPHPYTAVCRRFSCSMSSR